LGLRYTKDHKFGSENRRIVCDSDACMPGLYSAIGIGAFGVGGGTAANWGSLLGNLSAVPAVGQALANVGAIPQAVANALKPIGGLGNGAFDLTSTLAPKTPNNDMTGATGVTDPVTCTGLGTAAQSCKQGGVDPANGFWVRHLGDTSDATTGTLGVQWDPAEGTMFYGRYSRGYKAFGLAAGSLLQNPEAKPEFVNAYEVGLKKSFGRQLQVDAALYYLDYINLQAPVTVVPPGGLPVSAFVNVAKSRSTGLEADAIWAPTQGLRFMLDYSFDDTRIEKSDQFIDVNAAPIDAAGDRPKVNVVGNKLPQAPKNKVAFNGNYTFYLDSGSLNFGASYVWRDKAYSNIFTQSYNEAPAWSQVDLRTSWTPKDNKYQIIAYVKNVGDSKGYDAAVNGSQRATTAAAQNLELIPPRTYGVELHYKFF
jgi:iron complex outermembrane receptor protein